jgi:YVTN family beta-propeller protein
MRFARVPPATSHAFHVTEQGAGTLTVIDQETLEIIAMVTVGNSPYGVAARSTVPGTLRSRAATDR